MKPLFCCILCIVFSTSLFAQEPLTTEIHPDFKVTELTPHAWVHETTMTSENFGSFGCNGLIFVQGSECIIFDTPPTDSQSVELIEWLKTEKDLEVKAVVGNHYHEDCIGGLKSFHALGIPSYSSAKTRELAAKDSVELPWYTFEKNMVLQLGDQQVVCYYPGHAHAPDNIVAYLPSEKVLFGGCMVKSAKSGKGYLGVADVDEWPKTLKRVRERFGDAEWVIPGHGKPGGMELLDATVRIVTAPD